MISGSAEHLVHEYLLLCFARLLILSRRHSVSLYVGIPILSIEPSAAWDHNAIRPARPASGCVLEGDSLDLRVLVESIVALLADVPILPGTFSYYLPPWHKSIGSLESNHLENEPEHPARRVRWHCVAERDKIAILQIFFCPPSPSSRSYYCAEHDMARTSPEKLYVEYIISHSGSMDFES